MLLQATRLLHSQLSGQLETSDVKMDSQQDRLFELENLNQKLNVDKQTLVSKGKC